MYSMVSTNDLFRDISRSQDMPSEREGVPSSSSAVNNHSNSFILVLLQLKKGRKIGSPSQNPINNPCAVCVRVCTRKCSTWLCKAVLIKDNMCSERVQQSQATVDTEIQSCSVQ